MSELTPSPRAECWTRLALLPLVALIWPLGFAYGFATQAWRRRRYLWASRPRITVSPTVWRGLRWSAFGLGSCGVLGLLGYGVVVYVWPHVPSFSLPHSAPTGIAVDGMLSPIDDVGSTLWIYFSTWGCRVMGSLLFVSGGFKMATDSGIAVIRMGLGLAVLLIPAVLGSLVAAQNTGILR